MLKFLVISISLLYLAGIAYFFLRGGPILSLVVLGILGAAIAAGVVVEQRRHDPLLETAIMPHEPDRSHGPESPVVEPPVDRGGVVAGSTVRRQRGAGVPKGSDGQSCGGARKGGSGRRSRHR